MAFPTRRRCSHSIPRVASRSAQTVSAMFSFRWSQLHKIVFLSQGGS
jgi:hypothetical protein